MKEEIKKAYSEILGVCNKYIDEEYLSDYYLNRDIKDMVDKAKNHLMLIDWYEKYGLDLRHDITVYGRDYVRSKNECIFSYFRNAEEEKKNGSGKYISWSDDGRQPKDEWLLTISFSTGAYIFGEDYPTELFQDFFQELKAYNPKYIDSTNHYLYFAMENSAKIFNEYQTILDKYYEKNKEDSKQRKIKKLQDELSNLTK